MQKTLFSEICGCSNHKVETLLVFFVVGYSLSEKYKYRETGFIVFKNTPKDTCRCLLAQGTRGTIPGPVK